jgi:hypothetical protein
VTRKPPLTGMTPAADSTASRLISYRLPHGSANGSARNRPRQRKATLESNLPDSMSELARFAGTEIRSRPAAAHPRQSHAAAAAMNAGTSQFLCNRTYPESRREAAASKRIGEPSASVLRICRRREFLPQSRRRARVKEVSCAPFQPHQYLHMICLWENVKQINIPDLVRSRNLLAANQRSQIARQSGRIAG